VFAFGIGQLQKTDRYRVSKPIEELSKTEPRYTIGSSKFTVELGTKKNKISALQEKKGRQEKKGTEKKVPHYKRLKKSHSNLEAKADTPHGLQDCSLLV